MTQVATATANNPLNLGLDYTWQAGDTFATIALKYRRPKQYAELVDLNKVLLSKNNYLMRAGDVIKIPEDWFPLPSYEFGTKFKGSKGERV